MSVESTEALERSVLEGKDREQLLAIAGALGVKATSRAKKADIIAKILEQTGGAGAPAEAPAPARARARNGDGNGRAKEPVAVADAPLELISPPEATPPAVIPASGPAPAVGAPASAGGAAPTAPTAPGAEPAEPMAEWELAVGAELETDTAGTGEATASTPETAPAPGNRPYPPSAEGSEGTGQSNRRRRRRNRDRNRGDGPQGADRVEASAPQGQAQGGQESFQGEPVAVSGFLDLRD